MDLAADVARFLPSFRGTANSRMTETIVAGDYEDATDEVMGDPVRTLVTKLYEGPARVKYSANAARSDDRAGELLTTQDITVSIPTQPATLAPGDARPPGNHLAPAVNVTLPEGTAIRVVASAADPALEGRMFTVSGVAEMGQTTAHRYPVVELS